MKITVFIIILCSIFFSNDAFSVDHYWIGGTGSWKDTLSWSATSGGAAGNTIPSSIDNAIFDLNSGLTVTDTVYLDTIVTMDTLNFSALGNSFTISSVLPSISVYGSIIGNAFGANFDWIGGTIVLKPSSPNTIFSGSFIWEQDFQIDSTSTISLLDNLSNGMNEIRINRGGFNTGGFTVNCGNFISNTTNTRSIDVTASIINLSDSVLLIDSTNLSWTYSTATFNIASVIDTFTFSGGSLIYDSITSTTPLLQLFTNNTFNYFQSANGFQINNGDTLNIDSLVLQTSCLNPISIESTDPIGASALFNKIGTPIFNFTGLIINNVDAIAPSLYNLFLSDTINGAEGWIFGSTNFYWISDGGNWSDTTHWSFSSGGGVAGCIPKRPDFVFFDNQSFSLAGEIIIVDSLAEFSSMDWSNTGFASTLQLDTNMFSYGNTTLYPELVVTRANFSHGISFKDQALFNPDSSFIDCSINVNMLNVNDSLSLTNFLDMSDSSSILVRNGQLYTLSNNITTGAFLTLNDPGSGSDSRKVDFGSSTINLFNFFNALGDSSLTFTAGTSTINIGDTLSKQNSLETSGLTFYNVNLNFKKLTTTFPVSGTPVIQRIKGNNTFNKLRVEKESHVYFEAGDTQTINDSLIMVGNCRDSIFIFSTDTATFSAANINSVTSKSRLECVSYSGMTNTGMTLTTYYSNDSTSNTNWVFSTSKPVTAAFSAVGPFCFGDTTLFTNTSSTVVGGSTNFTSQWYYNDTTTGYYLFPLVDSIWINYEVDTLQHVFAVAGDITVDLQVQNNTNFCIDTVSHVVHINNPNAVLVSSENTPVICLGDSVAFSAISLSSGLDFQFFLNGDSLNTPSPTDTLYATDTLVNGDVVGLLAYENGCVADSMDTIQFTVYDLPVITWSSSDADTSICFSDSVYFTSSGGDAYQYFINTTPTSGFLVDSTYSTNSLVNNDSVSVIVRVDSTQCYNQSDPMIFTVHPLPTTSLATSITANNFCAETSVTFTASGANTYEFFIDGVSQGPASTTTTFTTTTLSTGDTITVVGYSSQGCSLEAPESYTYQVNPLPNVVLSISDADTSICSNDNVIFNASGAALYEFFINGISQGAASPTNSLSTTTLANNDSVYVLGTFSGCTGYSDTAIFEVLASPTTTLVSNDADSTICNQTEVIFTASGATTYQFYVDGVLQTPTTPTTFTTTSLTNGQIVSVIGTSNTCQVSQGIPFTVLAVPTVPLFSSDADNAICQGENITFTSANAATYELFVNGISQGAPQASSTFTQPLTPGVDTVTVVGIAANTCTDTSTMIIIDVTPTPVVTLTSSDTDDVICENESVTFTGAGSSQFQFLINGLSQGSLSATTTFTTTNLQNGDIVSITGSTNGCVATSNSISMTVNTIPTVTLASSDADNIFCIGDVVTFTSGGATNYEFFVGGVSQGASSPTNSLMSTGFVAGSYPVTVIGESNNCNNQTSLNVVVNDVPTATITSSAVNDTICQGAAMTYTATGGVTYEFFVNGVSQGIATALNTFTSASLVDGDSISVIVTSSSFCTGAAGANPITVLPLPTVALTSSDADTTICSGDMVTFTAAGATNYEFFVNGVSQGAASSMATFPTTNIANTDSIGVIGEINGCVSTSNGFTFSVNNAPLVLFTNSGASSICSGDNTNMQASGANNYEFFVNGISAGPSSPTNTFTSPLNDGDVVTVIGESNGCTSLSSSSFTFTVFNFPTLVATSSDADDIICLGEQVDFTASGAMTYTFDLNGTTIQSGTTNTFGLNSLLNGDIISITGYNGTCASATTSYTFTVNSMNLVLDVTPSSMICEGDAVTFTGTGADQYEFFLNGISTGAISATNTYISSSLADMDEVTFTGFNTTTACLQNYEGSIIMDVIATPLITPLSATTFCDGDSVQLSSNAPYGNQWVLDGSPIAGATDTIYTALVGGTYTLETTSGGLGTMWSFGQNATGTFANGNNFNNPDPTPANNAVMFDEISSGADFILAVSTTGEAYSWGENSSGQLGDGTYTNTNLPNLVPTLTGVKTVATTESSSMAVLATGDVYVWGNNTQGQLATGNTAVVNFPMLNAAVANTDSIAGGKSHFVILKNDGTVWAVGNNDFGQLGQGDLTSSMNAVQVAGLANIVSVGAGEYHSFAIDNLGDLYVWGNNGSGQLGLNDLSNRLSPALSPMKNVINAQGGANHSVFLTNTNKVYTSGGNSFGQLGIGSFTTTQEPTMVAIENADMISAGQYTTLVKRTDNSVFGFGNNTEDQLSSTTGTTVNLPEHISDLNGVGFIEAGKSASHVLYQEEQQCVSTVVNVTVNAVPSVTVTVNADTLTTIAGASYQWYLEGLPISGGTAQTLIATTTGNYSVQVTFANGCSGWSADTFVSFVGLEDLTLGTVKVYPNPTSNILHITFEKEMSGLTSIFVLDQTGRIVLEHTMNAQLSYSIDVNSLVDGAYFVKVKNEGRELVMRFIKSEN